MDFLQSTYDAAADLAHGTARRWNASWVNQDNREQ